MTKEQEYYLDNFEDVPPPGVLHAHIEWVEETDDGVGDGQTKVESVQHPRTGTKVDIYHSHESDTYSAQAKLGGMDDQKFVVQPDDPGSYISGGTSPFALGVEDLPTARALAYVWLRGWAHRNVTYGDDEGDVRDLGEQ